MGEANSVLAKQQSSSRQPQGRSVKQAPSWPQDQTGAVFLNRVTLTGRCQRRPSPGGKANMSKRSPIAGMFKGTHGFNSSIMIGFGRLSRLRFEILLRRQFRSMNLRTDT